MVIYVRIFGSTPHLTVGPRVGRDKHLILSDLPMLRRYIHKLLIITFWGATLNQNQATFVLINSLFPYRSSFDLIFLQRIRFRFIHTSFGRQQSPLYEQKLIS